MIRFLIRILLTAAAFIFVLPHIPGIDFHGNFWIAVGAAFLFGFIGAIMDLFGKLISAAAAISTLGLALLILVPMWIIGFWVVPAVVLELTSTFMPTHLTVNGWIPAFEGGLVLLVIGMLTSAPKKKKED